MNQRIIKLAIYLLVICMMVNVYYTCSYVLAKDRAMTRINELKSLTYYGKDLTGVLEGSGVNNITKLQWFYDESASRMYFHLSLFFIFGSATVAVIIMGLPDRHDGGNKIPVTDKVADPDDRGAP